VIRALLVLVALALCLGSAPASLWADEESPEKAQARVLLSQGNALFERGDLRGALADFRAAYALYPSPKLLINAAAAARELGDLAAAATDLRHFLDEATDEEGALVDKARADLKNLERRVGRVGLAHWPARSTLDIDGRTTRDPTYVKPGTHTLRGRTASGIEETVDVDVAAGESVDLAVPAGAELTEVARPSATPVHAVIVKKKKERAAWIVPVAVVTAVLVAGGVTAAIVFGTRPQPQPLKGGLGTVGFTVPISF
jgi:hypothetical protein